MRYFLFPRLRTLNSEFCGCAMLKAGWTHMTRRLEDQAVLILGRKGTTLIDDEGDILEVRPGRLVLLAPGRLHRGAGRIEEPVSYWWVHFRLDSLPLALSSDEARSILLSPDLSRERLGEAAFLPQTFDLQDSETAAHLFQELIAAHSEASSYTGLWYQTKVQQFLMYLTSELIASERGRALSPAAGATGTGLVPGLLACIEENLSDPDLSVKYLAASFGMNSDYLGRQFRSLAGLSLGQYIQKRRVELSRLRLRESRDTVEAIAKQCGFGSIRQFLHQFKAHGGMTPTEYRTALASIEINTL